MARKRGQNEGSIFQRADGRWEARISLGWANGKRVRRSFYGGTMSEVNALLLKARADHAAGLPVKTEKQTVGQFLERWLRNAAAPSVRALTLEHINSTCGSISILRLGKGRYRGFIRRTFSVSSLSGLHEACRPAQCA